MEENIQGSLEELQIPSETVLPEGVLTPAHIKSVAFTQTKPKGYHFVEVEQFVEAVNQSLTVLADLLHQRDKDIYKLAVYADRLKANNLNLQVEKNNLEFKQEEKMEDEVGLLMEANQKLQARIKELEAQPSVSPAFALSDLPEVEDLQRKIMELQTQLSQMQAKEKEIDEWYQQAEAYVENLETELEQYKKAYEAATSGNQPSLPQNTTTSAPPPEVPQSPQQTVFPTHPNATPAVDTTMFPNIRPEDL
jgi:cell division septum initiation protein DivIVA